MDIVDNNSIWLSLLVTSVVVTSSFAISSKSSATRAAANKTNGDLYKAKLEAQRLDENDRDCLDCEKLREDVDDYERQLEAFDPESVESKMERVKNLESIVEAKAKLESLCEGSNVAEIKAKIEQLDEREAELEQETKEKSTYRECLESAQRSPENIQMLDSDPQPSIEELEQKLKIAINNQRKSDTKYQMMKKLYDQAMLGRYEDKIHDALMTDRAKYHYKRLKEITDVAQNEAEVLREKNEFLSTEVQSLERDLTEKDEKIAHLTKELKKLQLEREQSDAYNLSSASRYNTIPPPPEVECPIDELLRPYQQSNNGSLNFL